MPAPYNLTEVTNSTGLGGFFTGLNTMTGGWLGLIMWITIFLITFLGLLIRGYEVRESFAAGSFFGFLIVLPLWSQAWVSDWILIINIVMVLGGFALLAFKQSP